MPITSYDRKRNAADLSSALGPLNTTSFLFDGDDEKPSVLPKKASNKPSPPDTKTFLQMQHTADGFPKLIRREDNGELVSGSSAALDLAFAQAPNAEQQLTDRGTASRHRISLPPSALSNGGSIAPLNSILANANDTKLAANNRRSMEVKFTAETKRPALMATPPRGMANGVAKAPYSTNDIPTLKSINGETNGGVSVTSPAAQPNNLNTTEQNAGSMSQANSNFTSNTINRQSQEFANFSKQQEGNHDIYSSQTGLQGGAAPFGPPQSHDQIQLPQFGSPTMSPYNQPPYYGGYGMQMLNNGFGNMNIGGGYGAQGQWPNQTSQYQPGPYNGYQPHPPNGQAAPGAGRYSDSQRQQGMQRKAQADDIFSTTNVSDLVGQINGLCRDQHGCRFLQRKLEEQNEQDLQFIFDEVKEDFADLMKDPFGNYLCQRLLEYSSEEQVTFLMQSVIPDMVDIAVNQHGTRALQKMIEYVATPTQIDMIIEALGGAVVEMIQDLNGNHVIQKCLNHLSAKDAQFIFDSVGANCVAVGTHRHGCCVLQRCVDHATGVQKGALVEHIIADAYALVQDPFGNYVVQYIIDLQEAAFNEPLCRQLAGNISYLSRQKFSSNVIEKILRSCSSESKHMLIGEINTQPELERLLRDSFANYVVQTALEFSQDHTKALMVENLRPMLPSIRHTPYGRRIQTKIQDYDGDQIGLPASTVNALANISNNHVSMAPNNSMNSTASYAARGPPSGRGNRMGMVGMPPAWGNNNGFGGAVNGAGGYGGPAEMLSPVPQRNQAYNLLNGTHNYPNPNHQNQGFGAPGYRQAPNYGHF